MEQQELFKRFSDGGRLLYDGQSVEFCDAAWTPHPTFAGVELKALVTAEQSGGRFSYHLVRIAPNREIGVHTHPEQLETHEVICGDGICTFRGQTLTYAPGVIAILPQNEPHAVTAGPEGLCLFAKFLPAC